MGQTQHPIIRDPTSHDNISRKILCDVSTIFFQITPLKCRNLTNHPKGGDRRKEGKRGSRCLHAWFLELLNTSLKRVLKNFIRKQMFGGSQNPDYHICKRGIPSPQNFSMAFVAFVIICSTFVGLSRAEPALR